MAKTLTASKVAPGESGKKPSPRARPRAGEGIDAADMRLRVARRLLRFGVWDTDVATGRETWTPEIEEIFGEEPGGFGGRFADFLEAIHPDDRARFAREHAARVGQGYPEFSIDFRIVRRDGAVRWINSRGVGVAGPDGKVERHVGICIDVTASKESESALGTASAQIAAALKSSKLLLFRQDRDLRYTWVANPALGFQPTEVLGQTDEEILGEAEAKPLVDVKRRVLRTGLGEHREVRLRHGEREGSFELIAEPEIGPDGLVSGIVGAAYDVSDRRRAEADREAMHRQLQDLAAHQRDALEAERGAVAKDVHDQVGAMLTGIAMKLSSMADRAAPECAELKGELAELAALTRSTLEATREICARLRPAVLDDLGLAEACRWYLREWERTSGIAASLRVVKLEPEPDDSRRIDLFRILQELLTNVARHAGASAVEVSLSSARREYRLRVADDGRGMAAGTRGGFGLSGVRERARRHGGRIDIETSRAGTTVTATLPTRSPA